MANWLSFWSLKFWVSSPNQQDNFQGYFETEEKNLLFCLFVCALDIQPFCDCSKAFYIQKFVGSFGSNIEKYSQVQCFMCFLYWIYATVYTQQNAYSNQDLKRSGKIRLLLRKNILTHICLGSTILSFFTGLCCSRTSKISLREGRSYDQKMCEKALKIEKRSTMGLFLIKRPQCCKPRI